MHRSAAERRKAGGENHRPIEQVRVGYYLFPQARLAGIEHRQDKTVQGVIGGALEVFPFVGFAILPAIQAFARFASQLSGFDHTTQPVWRRRLRNI